MGILSKLKTFLSTEQSEPPNPAADTTIPVEEPDQPVQQPQDTAEKPDEPTDATPEPVQSPQPADNPVETIKGIGPSYADKLSDAGIQTVSDLTTANPSELADKTGISETRIESWIELATTS